MQHASNVTHLHNIAARQQAVTGREAKPKLLDKLRETLHSRHYSRRTEQTYCHWVKRFIYFHNVRHPDVDRALQSRARSRRPRGHVTPGSGGAGAGVQAGRSRREEPALQLNWREPISDKPMDDLDMGSYVQLPFPDDAGACLPCLRQSKDTSG